MGILEHLPKKPLPSWIRVPTSEDYSKVKLDFSDPVVVQAHNIVYDFVASNSESASVPTIVCVLSGFSIDSESQKITDPTGDPCPGAAQTLSSVVSVWRVVNGADPLDAPQQSTSPPRPPSPPPPPPAWLKVPTTEDFEKHNVHFDRSFITKNAINLVLRSAAAADASGIKSAEQFLKQMLHPDTIDLMSQQVTDFLGNVTSSSRPTLKEVLKVFAIVNNVKLSE